MPADARLIAENALLLAVQRRLREPGSELAPIDLRGTGAIELLRASAIELLPGVALTETPRTSANRAPGGEKPGDVRPAPPVCRRLNDPSIVAGADSAATQLGALDSPDKLEGADLISERAVEKLHEAFLNHLVLNLLDIEVEYNLTPNQAWMLHLGVLGDVAEGRNVEPPDWHDVMADRIRLVVSHETPHPRALLPFDDRSMTDGVLLLKLDKHYDESSWLHLHALLQDLTARPIQPSDPMWLLHEVWNENEFLLAAIQIKGRDTPLKGKAPSGWCNDWDPVDRIMLVQYLDKTVAELGQYVTSSDRIMLGGRVLVAAGNLTDWFNFPGATGTPTESPSFSFQRLRHFEAGTSAERFGTFRSKTPASRAVDSSSTKSQPEAAEAPTPSARGEFAPSLEDAVSAQDGGPGATFRADTAIAYVQARANLGKGGLLRVKQVTVDARDEARPTLSVVVESDVLRRQDVQHTHFTPRPAINLANWSGWHATLKSPGVLQEAESERTDVSPRRSAVVWEGVMTLDQGTELTRATVTDRLEDLLRRLNGEGFDSEPQ